MKRRLLFLPFISLLIVLSCDRPDAPKRKIKLAESPGRQPMERFTSTIHLEPTLRRAVAVLFFENQTGDQNLEWLQKGLTEMFIRSLSQSSSLSVLSTDRIFEIMKQAGQSSTAQRLDFELAAIVSKEANVEAVLTGAISRHGDSLQINVKVHEPNQGKILKEEHVEGKDLNAIFAMVDQLTEKVKNSLAVSLEKQELAKSIADLSTRSLQAWRHYTAGMDFDQKAMRNEAIEHFQKAVEADPTFVAAYYRLSLYLFSQGEREKGYEAFAKLKALRPKATAREQYQIDWLESSVQRDLGSVIDISKRWLEKNPNDVDAYFTLGDIHFSLQNYDEALSYYQSILAIDPKYKMAYNQLGYCYARKGDLANAVAIMKQYQSLAPDEPNPFDSMGEIYFNYGDYPSAEKNLRRALKIDENFTPSWLMLSDLYLDQGENKKALAIIQQSLPQIKDPRSRANGLAQLGFIQWRLGKIDEAIQSMQKCVENRIAPYRAATWVNELYLQKGDTLNGRATLLKNYAFIRDSLAKRDPIFIVNLAQLSLWYNLQAEATIELIQRTLTKPVQPEVQLWGKFYLAMLYLKTQRLNEYKKITPDFATEFIGLLKDFREVLSARETWKSFMFFNQYAYGAIDEGIAKYHQLIQYSLDHQLIIPEMIFRLFLVDLYTVHHLSHQAEEQLKMVGAPREQQWLVIAPYDNTNGFQKKYPPEREILLEESALQAGQPRWRHPDDGLQEGYINLKQMYKNYNWSLGYGLILIKSPDVREAQIRIGTNDSAKLWLNDVEVWRMNLGRDAIFDNDIIPVTLRPGINKVLIKVCNRISEWGFYFRVTDKAGRGMPGLEFVAADGGD